jgi:hypothetical protein
MIDYKSTALKDRLIISYSNLARSFNKRKNIHFPFVVEIRLDSLQQYDISNKSFSKIAERNILLTDGFIFIDKDALNTHQETVRKIFKPNKVFIKKIENLKQNFFSKYEKIVGVHIRKGDYLTFLNGRWNYSNQDYLSFMKQILLLPSLSNKKVAFLLCSNEDIEIKDFEGVPIIYSMKHFIEDLYALASCDLIIGPPSTFSSWASFYGKVPLFQIEDKVTKINEECFQIRENI